MLPVHSADAVKTVKGSSITIARNAIASHWQRWARFMPGRMID
jgi:predicted nucleotidyltransferase